MSGVGRPVSMARAVRPRMVQRDQRRVVMFSKILIANRGDNGRKTVAAKPNRMVRVAHAGEFPAEPRRV